MNKVKLLALTALLSATTLISSCSATAEECDPSVELNVFSKAACKFSGSYDQRIEQKEKILLNEQETNKKFRQIYADIQAQQKSVNQSISQKKAQQAKLTKSLNSLTRDLKQKAKGRSDLQAQIAEVEKQLNGVNNSGASEVEKQVQLQALQQKLGQLQKTLGL
ncbi:hypothetical protein FHQ28_06610 [Pasteurellaceae bacterium USgator11]|nr:hypothetical protein FHQ19_04300 [Pasteurellaceae bacterium UScroc12]TNG97143.1 hypothetical protein FHQ20_03770 [Pasteurellaceae bacterium USgator41]TNH01148.1 hypothetical protein FHQ28_06610 [Pasteurellaceae bacterium USgator11]TNH01895.1 hypothetical protein FHQ24_00155 [Pasteurellaceae bacterium UScroc31]